METRQKFRNLLREIFQFESAELDFGIYRIMNHKRAAIENFIENDLEAAVQDGLKEGLLQAQTSFEEDLKTAKKNLEEKLGPDAIIADGELNPKYNKMPITKSYRNARGRAGKLPTEEEMQQAAFNHLLIFFSRYYEDGDFISKRRYSARERYAIPYNGEEVHLHWANRDQYYIKTGENFARYQFRLGQYSVHFTLQNADTEQDNKKGDKRFFFPLAKQASCDGNAITIPFDYRPFRAGEKARVGGGNSLQEKILQKALPHFEKTLPVAGDELLSHLHRYTRRNTSDYFIHKNLQSFLSRELDFYIKNEVLSLDDLESAGEFAAEGRFHLLRVICAVGGRIIEFLAQIENFQKRLFEKKKFVTQTHWCAAVGQIQEEKLLAEIAACDAQWKEWRALLDLKPAKARRREALRANPTLLVDTVHFGGEFRDRLLAQFQDIDGACNGLLIRGENFHGLNLLSEKYRKQVKCIYIDPPYNTGVDGFIFKDNYQHSSWMSMMFDRIQLGKSFLLNDGNCVIHIDEHEFENLKKILSVCFGENALDPIVWDKRNPKGDATGIAAQHEYVCWAVPDKGLLTQESLIRKKVNAEQMIQKAKQIVRSHGVNDEARNVFKGWVRGNSALTQGEKAYNLLDEHGQVHRAVSMAWPNKQQAPDDYFIPLKHPITGKNCPVPERGWRSPSKTMQKLLASGQILFGPDEKTQPNRKYLLEDNLQENVPSLYYYGGSDDKFFQNIGINPNNGTPKPCKMACYLLDIGARNKDAIVVDFFAGTGTAGHAVINLNREDGGQRKFILIEMGDHFDNVLLPRIKKITYAPEWKDGKPRRATTPEEAARSPRLLKYQRLESYEDALENIQFKDDNSTQAAMKFPDYLLRYMLDWETRQSPTLLNPAQLSTPFNYKLRLRRNGNFEETPVDLPETFNYLIGLQTRTRRTLQNGPHAYLIYTGLSEGHPTTIIWRTTKDWTPTDFERDRDFLTQHALAPPSARIYTNSDSLLPHAQSLDPIFQKRLFAPETG